MNNKVIQSNLTVSGSSTIRWRTIAPIVVLIVLSPILTELLMGVVHLTNIWLLFPEMGVYGFAALLIREVVRRQQRGWGAILLLGIAFAIAEECVILQTSFTPQFFPPAFAGNFGWALGVQWIYLTAMLWYESVFAIVLPITLTEIIFPERREGPWLDRRGGIAAMIVFLLASAGVWWLWHYHGLVRYGPSTYQVPLANVGIALVAIVLLVTGTLMFRPLQVERKASRKAWAPWLVGLLAFGHTLVWFVLIALAYIPASTFRGASPLIPITVALVWVGLALLFVGFLSRADHWGDRQRLALIFGASLGSMVGGVLVILAAEPIDQIGKLVIDLVAVVLFILLVRRVKQRTTLG